MGIASGLLQALATEPQLGLKDDKLKKDEHSLLLDKNSTLFMYYKMFFS